MMLEPEIAIEQFISATSAARSFSELRKRTIDKPVFIISNNSVDTVILSYQDYLRLINNQK